MYYEVYLDSLFLLNFTLNLYLLYLLNYSLNHTATWGRLLLGAALSAAGYCLMVILPFPFRGGAATAVRLILTAVLVNGGALWFVFRPTCIKAFLRIAEKMLLYTFFAGGAFWFLLNHRVFQNRQMPMLFVLFIGGLCLPFFSHRISRQKKEKQEIVQVTLVGKKGGRVSVKGIVDTGNSLREPISGKPVSVLEREAFFTLLSETEGLRVIPYHSVGCEHGILEGYEIAEMKIEKNGIEKVCRNAYVGICENRVSAGGSYQLLLNPALFEK